MKVPFQDLHKQYLGIKDEIDDAINNVIRNSSFVRGRHVEEFEKTFSNLMGTKRTISCANGTDALYIAMKQLGVKNGDEIIVPAHSWISTSETVSQAGGTPIFCEVNKLTCTIDENKIKEKITDKTVGIIPVHLFGQSANMMQIMQIAKKYSLWVIEDCAQAILAKHHNKKVGTFGNASTFSFYPGKNLGAMGDAGAIITNDNDLADKMASFARHGGLIKGSHEFEGINSRMDGIQAAILNVKLRYIKKWTTKRRSLAKRYLKNLRDLNYFELPYERKENYHVWHLFVIETDEREELIKFLDKKNISTSINYPCALPFLPAYKRFKHNKNEFPISHSKQSKILSLPLFPEIEESQIDYLFHALRNFKPYL